MKKIIVIGFLALLTFSCGVSKVERNTQKMLKGNWTLTEVQLPSALVDVELFDDVDSKCFTHSDWNFIPNNNQGAYELSSCSQHRQKFHWSIQEGSSSEFYLLLKPEVDGVKARKVSTGYRLELIGLNEYEMVWEQRVSFEGRPFTIRMNFVKN